MKYGPLKEIWLASYAPFYAFVVYRNRIDAQVEGGEDTDITLKILIWVRRKLTVSFPCVRTPARGLTECGLLGEGSE